MTMLQGVVSMMDADSRRKNIVDELKQHGTVRISQLSAKLNTTRETIRKDIYSLESEGALKVIRGGATLPSTVFETKYGQRQSLLVEEKKKIAKTAVDLVEDGMSIFLDYGTTSFAVAEELKRRNFLGITVVTTSIHVIDTLQYEDNIELIALGGTLRKSEGSFSGPITLNAINGIFCNIGFFGSGGVDGDAGITNHYQNEIEVSKKMMEHCKVKTVLADHTKFGEVALYRTAGLDEIDKIITDTGFSDSQRRQLEASGASLKY